MATVVFDFDSTLITCESLDEILALSSPDDAARIREITDAGMEGRIRFCESLMRRLAIAQPTRAQVEAFGQAAVNRLAPGMEGLVKDLAADVWIVSGGLLDVLAPVAAHLGIEHVLGTRARWSDDGSFAGIDNCQEKAELAADHAGAWSRPRIGVGDGMSDHALLAAGHVDHFIAFTAIVRRGPVVATGAPEAASVPELRYLLSRLLR